MMLMLCTMFAFSACSSDDDDEAKTQSKRIESISIANHSQVQTLASLYGLTDDVLKLYFNYNADGTLKSITSNCNMGWEFTYTGNTIATTDGQFSYTVDDQRRIVSHTAKEADGSAEYTYNWSYDADGYLKSIVDPTGKGTGMTLTYTDGNLSSYQLYFKSSFTTDRLISSCAGTIDPAFLVDVFAFAFQREDLFLGMVLNQNVKVSAYVPSQVEFSSTTNGTKTATLQTSFSNNTLTVKNSTSYLFENGHISPNTTVVTYTDK